MQLNDILEEHSLKNISKKTNISEDNIEYLLERKFEKLERVKAMGFISIIEREFKANLATLRNEAQDYYAEHDNADRGIVVTGKLIEEKRGKSKWLFFIVLILLAYASWYFVTQYDKSHLNTLQPAKEEVEERLSEEELAHLKERLMKMGIEETEADLMVEQARYLTRAEIDALLSEIGGADE